MILVVALLVEVYISFSQPNDYPPTLTWTQTQLLRGNGTTNTEQFQVSAHWKLQWRCQPATSAIGQYNVIIYVVLPDGSEQLAINTICAAGNIGGETIEYQGGTIYLHIVSDYWSISVYELE